MNSRTVVHDPDNRRAEIMHRNERGDVLRKMSSGSRVPRLGQILRNDSFDELPRFFKVIMRTIGVVIAGSGAWQDRFRDFSFLGQSEPHRFSASLSSSLPKRLERQRQALLAYSVFPSG